MGDVDFLAGQLHRLAPPVRADFLRIARTVVREVPTRWSRRRGVPFLWIELTDPTDPDAEPAVRVESTIFSQLGSAPLADSVHHSFRSDVTQRLGAGRCAALVYGSAYFGQSFGLFGLPFRLLDAVWSRQSGAVFPLDKHVAVHAAHRTGRQVDFSLRFHPEGRLPPRLVFDEDLTPLADPDFGAPPTES